MIKRNFSINNIKVFLVLDHVTLTRDDVEARDLFVCQFLAIRHFGKWKEEKQMITFVFIKAAKSVAVFTFTLNTAFRKLRSQTSETNRTHTHHTVSKGPTLNRSLEYVSACFGRASLLTVRSIWAQSSCIKHLKLNWVIEKLYCWKDWSETNRRKT